MQNALKSFAEMSEQYPLELKRAAEYSHELEPTDDTGQTLVMREFVSVSCHFHCFHWQTLSGTRQYNVFFHLWLITHNYDTFIHFFRVASSY